jgi:uncharacterized protein DUF2017
MLIYRSKRDRIEFAEVDPFEAEFLRQIPVVCDSGGDPRVEERFFSAPAEASEVQLRDDWVEYVQPELRQLFISAKKLVESDLSNLLERELAHLSIPLTHGDAWLNTLNQARLNLATRYEFTDEELSSSRLTQFKSRRDLALHQINFYAGIQERIIEALEG